MKLSRNDPCPCGSGKKYKRCHLAEDEAAASARRAEEYLVASEGVSDESLELAREYFAARDRGAGPAQQMMDFVRPLLDENATEQRLNQAVQLGAVFWNLALLPPDAREEEMRSLEASGTFDPEARVAFYQMAEMMIARHERMFPELHAGPGRSE